MNLAIEIRQRLAALAPEKCELQDDSALHAGHAGAAGGGHWRLHLVSRAFCGLSPVARHRMVYAALEDLLAQQHIHALALTTRTPEEAV